ncbi:MAG: hypothetical protein J3Q66DRAFT_366700 [Benniella sp.]|nr:MAG: hypothetical protein J3Q66DRAFT_366700 [Benniella sp.]
MATLVLNRVPSEAHTGHPWQKIVPNLHTMVTGATSQREANISYPMAPAVGDLRAGHPEQGGELTTVKEAVDGGLSQPQTHTRTIEKGCPSSYTDAGIIDDRVKVVQDWDEYLHGYIHPHAIGELHSRRKCGFCGVVEVLLAEPGSHVPELCLVVDGSKVYGEGRFGFVDLFIPRKATGTVEDQTRIILELKNTTLEGLWKGAWNNSTPQQQDLEKLQKTLRKENENSLLARKYCYYSQEQKRMVFTTVKEVVDGGLSQLETYMQTIKKGCPSSYTDAGIIDGRVKVVKDGHYLQGNVVFAIGGPCILVYPTRRTSTNWQYQRALQL